LAGLKNLKLCSFFGQGNGLAGIDVEVLFKKNLHNSHNTKNQLFKYKISSIPLVWDNEMP